MAGTPLALKALREDQPGDAGCHTFLSSFPSGWMDWLSNCIDSDVEQDILTLESQLEATDESDAARDS